MTARRSTDIPNPFPYEDDTTTPAHLTQWELTLGLLDTDTKTETPRRNPLAQAALTLWTMGLVVALAAGFVLNRPWTLPVLAAAAITAAAAVHRYR